MTNPFNNGTTNWKTTTAALLTAFFAYIVATPEDFAHYPWLINISKFAALGGLSALGIVSKDSK